MSRLILLLTAKSTARSHSCLPASLPAGRPEGRRDGRRERGKDGGGGGGGGQGYVPTVRREGRLRFEVVNSRSRGQFLCWIVTLADATHLTSDPSAAPDERFARNWRWFYFVWNVQNGNSKKTESHITWMKLIHFELVAGVNMMHLMTCPVSVLASLLHLHLWSLKCLLFNDYFLYVFFFSVFYVPTTFLHDWLHFSVFLCSHWFSIMTPFKDL